MAEDSPEVDPSERFAGTAAHYAAARPGYGSAAMSYLRDRFELDESARVFDLGCGAGQVAVPLAEFAGHVVGFDPNAAMLRQARRRAERTGLTNTDWIVASDAELRGAMGPVRLTTMGRSFHWMDRQRTLDRLQRLTESGGGVALLSDPEWVRRGPESWQAATYDVAARYLDDLPERETGEIDYETPYSELLAEAGLSAVERVTFTETRVWDIDSVVGYVFSLSFASPDEFGADAETFERDLRERLAEIGGGPFEQTAEVSVVSGFVESRAI